MNEKVTAITESKAQPSIMASLSTHGGLIPTNLEQLWRLSVIMAKSGMMPKGIQTPEAVAVAVQMGLEIGLSPMQAVQNIAVINGRPSIWGDSVLGLVRASGKLEGFDEHFTGEGEQLKAVCIAKRKDQEKTIENSFSVADAKRAELWGNNVWAKYPKRMLQMRARSWTLRDGFGDILKGLRVAEEVIDLKQDGLGDYIVPDEGAFNLNGDPETLIAAFDEQFGEETKPFVETLMAHYKKTEEEIKVEAMQDPDNFRVGFESWKVKQTPSQESQDGSDEEKTSSPGVPSDDPDADPFRKEWINLRTPGFATYVHKHLELFRGSEHEAEAKEKWKGHYSEPWPLDPPAELPKEISAAEVIAAGIHDRREEEKKEDNGPLLWCAPRERQIYVKICQQSCEDKDKCQSYQEWEYEHNQ